MYLHIFRYLYTFMYVVGLLLKFLYRPGRMYTCTICEVRFLAFFCQRRYLSLPTCLISMHVRLHA